MRHFAAWSKSSGRCAGCGRVGYSAPVSGNGAWGRGPEGGDAAALRARVDELERTVLDMFQRNTAVKLLIDPEGGAIVDANEAAAAFYGFSREELATMTIMDLNQLPNELVQREMERAGSERRSYFEFKHRLRSGDLRDVQVYSGPCQVGERRLLFSVICDITERNRLAEQLGHAQRMDALGRLAGGVAHDFNNLLMTVEIIATIVGKRAERGQDVRAEVDELRDLVGRGEGLTRQLLAFCRRQVMRTVLVDLAEVVAGMSQLLTRLVCSAAPTSGATGSAMVPVEPGVTARPIRLELDLDASDGPAHVIGDPSQLEQVVLNLALNGRDAMPAGGRLAIRVRHVSVSEAEAKTMGVKPGAFVLLAVSDEGVGIEPAQQRHVFEPFFTTKPTGQGTGLGLATAYGIVHQSGGTITLRSAPGAGSTFQVWLPDADKVSGGVIAASAGAARARLDEPTAEETILVVDDEASIRRGVRQVLESGGYQVIEAGDGREGLEVARAHHGPIDLVLTDVVMPRAGGRELARDMVRDRPAVRVLFMSGYVDSPAVDQGMLDVGEWFLAKPFTAEALLAKVREVLNAPSRHPSPPM
jgi:two-component system cell cycle sensor histidine kinase/response regulator CckA